MLVLSESAVNELGVELIHCWDKASKRVHMNSDKRRLLRLIIIGRKVVNKYLFLDLNLIEVETVIGVESDWSDRVIEAAFYENLRSQVIREVSIKNRACLIVVEGTTRYWEHHVIISDETSSSLAMVDIKGSLDMREE